MRRVDKIIIHCSDTPHSMRVDVDTIRRWHVEDNGWSDIGYHWYIDQLGELHEGRNEDIPGAHCKGHNKYSIGICLEGRDEFTEHQFSMLRFLLSETVGRYGVRLENIKGHRDFDSGKTCPNFDAKQLLEKWNAK